MDLVRNYLSGEKTFKLANNIDLSPLQYGQTQNTDGSWKPIGDSTNKFGGHFDGNGYSVSGIYINSSSFGSQGLFGFTDSGSIIENVGVTNDSISSSGENNIGGVSGYSGGSVTDCYNAGSVNCSNQYCWVGGVVGNSVGSVTDCYNTGTVTSTDLVGGIVGL